MSYLTSESFDPPGSIAELQSRHSSITGANNLTLSAANTPFGVGQVLASTAGLANNVIVCLSDNFSQNATTLYGSMRINQTTASPSAGACAFVSFNNAQGSQCSIRWNGDGSITLLSGPPVGTNTVLQTYTGQFSAQSWSSWQFAVVISTSNGSITMRKNGSQTAAITLTGVNTSAASSTNVFASSVSYGFCSSANNIVLNTAIDDFFLCSGDAVYPNTWTGDIRAVQQVPNGQTQAQFAPAPVIAPVGFAYTGHTLSVGSNTIVTSAAIAATKAGSIASVTIQAAASYTGHLQLGLYDASGIQGMPGSLIGVSQVITNVSPGNVTGAMTFPPSITVGSNYYVAVLGDANLSLSATPAEHFGDGNFSESTPYSAGFLSSMPTTAGSTMAYAMYAFGNIACVNWGLVDDLISDEDTTYVSSSTPGQQDVYTLGSIPTSYQVLGVEYYALWRKADAGPRTVQLSVLANSGSTALITQDTLGPDYTYSDSFMAADPTGASWTPVTVNGAQIGVAITQ